MPTNEYGAALVNHLCKACHPF